MKPLFAAILVVGLTWTIPSNAGSFLSVGPQLSDAVSVSLLDRIQALKGKEGVVLAACCKKCRKGKACGNSCINRSYTCTKGRGCACDG